MSIAYQSLTSFIVSVVDTPPINASYFDIPSHWMPNGQLKSDLITATVTTTSAVTMQVMNLSINFNFIGAVDVLVSYVGCQPGYFASSLTTYSCSPCAPGTQSIMEVIKQALILMSLTRIHVLHVYKAKIPHGQQLNVLMSR